MIILGHHFILILLAKKLIWAPFLQSMCNLSFGIKPQQFLLKKNMAHILVMNSFPADTNLNLTRFTDSNSFLAIESPALFF